MSDLSTVISSNAPIGGTSVSVVLPTGTRRTHLHSTVNSQSGPGPGSGPFVVVKSIAPRHTRSHHTSGSSASTSSSSSFSSRQAPSVVGARTKPDIPSLVTVSPSSTSASGRTSMTSTIVNHCDNGISQSQQNSLTNCNSNKSFTNNSPTNYILRNKLRFREARNRGKSTAGNASTTTTTTTTTNGTSRSEHNTTQPSSLSLSQKSISTVNSSNANQLQTSRRGSSAGPTRQASSSSSVQNGSHRTGSGGHCNTAANSSSTSSHHRPVITRVNAHEWLTPAATPTFSSGNHSAKGLLSFLTLFFCDFNFILT